MTNRIEIPLQDGFDPARHVDRLTAGVNEKCGGGWFLQTIDTSNEPAKAIFTRRSVVTSVATSADTPETFEVRLSAADSKPAMGDKVAREQEDTYPGFFLTVFDPHLGRARLTKMAPALVRARGAVATALGVKPWDIQVTPRVDGGVDVQLSRNYMPSRHDEKLTEVATQVVGRPGWFVRIDTQALTASLIPGELPTFEPFAPYPLDTVALSDNARPPLGLVLGVPGSPAAQPLSLDLDRGPHTLLSGLTNSGKSVLVNGFIVHQLLTKSELVLIDLPHKAVDYLWCQKYCRPGGWGCDSLEAAVTALSLVYEDGVRRAELLKEHRVQKISQLPEGVRPAAIAVVVDELTGLIQGDPVNGMPKGSAVREETEYENLLKATILQKIKKIAAELRFVGVRLLLASQVLNQTTGVPPSLKTNLPNKILMGVKPTRRDRGHVFSDEGKVPTVPDYLQVEKERSAGVGTVELDGIEPAVIKGYYAQLADFERALAAAGLPETASPSPSAGQIAAYTAAMQPDHEDEPQVGTPSGKPLDPKFGPVETFDANGNKLFGAAAAAAASKAIAADAAVCPQCAAAIRPDGSCRCD